MVYVIAAIDDNHNGDLELAMRLIDIAVSCGCNAIKVISRTTELSAPATLLDRPSLRYPSLGRTMREVRSRLALSREQLATLCSYAGDRVDYLIAPYDVEAVEQLRDLDMRALKVDPPAVVHLELLQAVARRRLPVYAGAGMCTEREVQDLLTELAETDVTLLHTICSTPFQGTLLHLRGMEELRRFGRPLGHSDNQPGFTLSSAAVLLGAVAVEKRVTIDRTMEGPHHAQSLLPTELRDMVRHIRELTSMPAERIRQEILSWDTETMDERPSIVAKIQIPKGQVITGEMLTVKPPARGLSPRLLPWVKGRRARYDIEADDYITFGLVE